MILGVVIAAAIMSIVIVFYHLTGYIMPAISNRFDNEFHEGVSVRIQCLDLDNLEILDDLGAKDINVKCSGSNQFYKSLLKVDEKGIEIADKDFRWFTKESYQSGEVPHDIDWEEFNVSENAILYCSAVDRKKFNEGDVLSLYLQNGTLVNKFVVETIVLDETYSEPYVILPAVAVIEKMDECGISISYHFECTVLKASKYVEFKKKIEIYGAYCSCDFDNILDLVSTLKNVFKILAIIFIVVSIFILVTIAIININTREKFMILQKVLGAADYNIIIIYMIILEIEIIVADILGYIIGHRFAAHLSNIVSVLYEMDYIMNNAHYFWLLISSILISNIAMFPLVFFIKKVVNSKDIVSVINNKD